MVSITDRYFYVIKKNIVDAAGEQLNYLMQNRNAYLSQFFERIAEQQKFQRELWEIYYEAKAEKDRNVQFSCLNQLEDISVHLTNMYTIIPNISGLQFSEVQGITAPEEGHDKHINGFSKDCKVCIEHRPDYSEDPERKF
jgi:hypothetical protein